MSKKIQIHTVIKYLIREADKFVQKSLKETNPEAFLINYTKRRLCGEKTEYPVKPPILVIFL